MEVWNQEYERKIRESAAQSSSNTAAIDLEERGFGDPDGAFRI
jgi:hypothetical protein